MIVENSLNEKIEHEETSLYHNSTEVDYFTKEIQKPRMKKHTNEPITLPKPLHMLSMWIDVCNCQQHEKTPSNS